MAYLLLTLSGIIAIFFLKKDWVVKKQLSFILFFLLISLGLYLFIDLLFVEHYVTYKNGSGIWSAIPWLEIGLYVATLAGMVANYLFDAIKDNTISIQKWRMVKPFLVSPIIFGVVYGTLGEETSKVLLLITAFQNGFFWQTVFDKVGK